MTVGLLTVEELGWVYEVNPASVYRKPSYFGAKRIRGAGIRAPIDKVCSITGLSRETVVEIVNEGRARRGD